MENIIQWVGIIIAVTGTFVSSIIGYKSLKAARLESAINSFLTLSDRYHNLFFSLIEDDHNILKRPLEAVPEQQISIYQLIELLSEVDDLKKYQEKIGKNMGSKWEQRQKKLMSSVVFQCAWDRKKEDKRDLYSENFVTKIDNIIISNENIRKKAYDFAKNKHSGQLRKGSNIPYITHPVHVAKLVEDSGGTEVQVAAAYLHDVVEDCGVTAQELKEMFGEKITQIVLDCSDSKTSGPKAPWKERKVKYIQHLEIVESNTLLVSLCDKLHNALATVDDITTYGVKVWERFNANPKEISWYYQSLLKCFKKRSSELGAKDHNLIVQFQGAVLELEDLSIKSYDVPEING